MLLPYTLTNLLLPFLHRFSPENDLGPSSSSPGPSFSQSRFLQFELRHVFGATSAARVVIADVHRDQILNADTNMIGARDKTYTVHTRRLTSFRPASSADFAEARVWSAKFGQSAALDWDEDAIEGPDVESRETLLQLAKMTNNAYIDPKDPAWYDLGGNWNVSYPFGWDADGFRGHVFATPDNKTVVISVKGATTGLFGGGPTGARDKLNNNILFSCCCAYVDRSWSPVCGCYRGGWKCDQDCVENAMVDESLFYHIGTNLYNNLTYIYPDSNIWIVGHSLGGALASLLGVTFGVPVVAFESPGDKLAAQRLHLPSPPSTQHITHVYHTADPVPAGTCTGYWSLCAWTGYALETRCHLGRTILYDTVGHLSWSVNVRTHGIVNIINDILSQPWAPSEERGRQVPEAKPEEDCVDCFNWEYGDFPPG